jgi:hypothetical protein
MLNQGSCRNAREGRYIRNKVVGPFLELCNQKLNAPDCLLDAKLGATFFETMLNIYFSS